MLKVNARVNNEILVDGIILMLGIVVLSQFFVLLFRGCFSIQGFITLIKSMSGYWAPGSWPQILFNHFIAFASIYSKCFALSLAASAVCLITFTGRGVVALLTGFGFLLSWVLLWPYPGMWTFEFLFPALFGITAGLATYRSPLISPSIYALLNFSKWIGVLIISGLSALIWYFTAIATHTAFFSSRPAIYLAITFFIISFSHLFSKHSSSRYQPITKHASVYLDIMIIIIGAMLVMQVYADYFSNLYQLKGYTDLVQYYSTVSGAVWLRPMLVWSVHHSNWLMPLQEIFEIVAAVLLTTLIWRGPILIASGLLFGFFGLIELGISANWPPDLNNLTWEWELLLAAGVSLWIGFGKLQESLAATNVKERVFGHAFWNNTPFLIRAIIAFFAGVVLYYAGIATEIFGSAYRVTSLYSGITFFLLLVVSAMMENLRKKL